MNIVTISGIVKGGFNDLRQDTKHFVLVNKGRDEGEVLEYDIVAHGDIATRLASNVKSGQRTVLQGRLSSEKFNEEDKVYHSVIVVSRVLSDDGKSGMDYNSIMLEGVGNCSEVKQVGSKNQDVANIDIKHTRKFKDREGVEKSFSSFISASIWGERAKGIESSLPFTDQPMIITGTLRPREYENKDGNTVKKIDVWVDELFLISGSPITSIPQKYEKNRESGERKSARGGAKARATLDVTSQISGDSELPF